MSVEFDMSEVTALAAELAAAPVKAKRASSESLTKIAAKFRDDARTAAPVSSGALRDSIKVRGGADYRIITATARHAFFVEFGTSKMQPQPFMWPQVPTASRAIEDALGDISPFD